MEEPDIETPQQQHGDEDEMGENICRVCRGEGTPENPLFHPCRCSGSIKYIHQDCLVGWLEHSQVDRCELCKYSFTFTPGIGLAKKTGMVLLLFLRYVVVIVHWLVFVPIILTRIWRMFFGTSATGFLTPILNWSDITASTIFLDCLRGLAISAMNIFLVLSISALREYIVFNMRAENQAARQRRRQAREHQQQQQQQAQPVPRAQLRPPPLDQDPESEDDEDDDDDMVNMEPRPAGPVNLLRHRGHAGRLGSPQAQVHDDGRNNDDDDDGDEEDEDEDDDDDDDDWVDDEEEDTEDDSDDDEQIETENEDDVVEEPAAPMAPAVHPGGHAEANNPPLPQDAQGHQNDNVDAEGADAGDDIMDFAAFLDGPREDMTITELLGFKGPIINLVENVCGFILFNIFVLALFGFIPILCGKMLLSSAAGQNILVLVAAPFIGHGAVGANITTVANLTVDTVNVVSNAADGTTANASEALSAGIANATLASLQTTPSDLPIAASVAQTLFLAALGYGVIISLWASYVGLVSYVFRNRGNTRTFLLIKRCLTFTLIFLKVALLMACELGVFPLMCGILIDYSLTDILGYTWESRITFFQLNILTSYYLHWLLGMIYMFNFASFVGLVREMLRPGVLWFLRNPNDPSFNPFAEMIEISLMNHLRRMLISAVLYIIHIVIMVMGVAKLACVLFPNILPLRLFSTSIYDVPFDLLLIHFVLPVVISWLRPRQQFHLLVKTWLHVTAKMLKLSAFLFGGDHPDEHVVGGRMMTVPNTDSYRPMGMYQAPQLPGTVLLTSVYVPLYFPFRVIVLLMLLCITAACFIMSIVLGPVVLGRLLFEKMYGPPVDDIYSFALGSAVAIFIYATGIYSSQLFSSHAPNLESLGRALRWTRAAAFVIVSFGILIPTCMGLMWGVLVMRPLEMLHYDSIQSAVLDMWMMGVFQCAITFQVIMNGPPSAVRDALVEMQTQSWVILNIHKLLSVVVLPTLAILGVSIVAPWLQVRTVIALFKFGTGYEMSQQQEDSFDRYAHISTLAIIVIGVVVLVLFRWILRFEKVIRDELYLVGRRLHNFDGAAVVLPSNQG